MKKLLSILLVLICINANAQLTLTEKHTLSESATFRGKIYQGMVSKANFWVMDGTPQNLKEQKLIEFSTQFVKGKVSFDLYITTRYWLANYNVVPELVDNQPSDNAILNTAALDVVYNTLAGVLAGDQNLPIQ